MLNKPYFDDVMQSIREAISNNVQAVVYLEAGHFDPRYGATEFSRISLEDALQLTKILIKEFGRNIKIVLGILVDDLGLECSADACTIPLNQPKPVEDKATALPNELEDILSSSLLVKRDRIILSSEKTCKNRGLLKLKKLLKSASYEGIISLLKDDAGMTRVSFKDSEQNDILLAEFSGSIWKAKCPTIMGQHYIDCFVKIQQRFNHIQKLIIIDWTEMLDYSKVTAGSQAAMKVFKTEGLNNLDLEIYNIFFCDNIGEIYEIKQFNNQILAEKP
jgi:hypothetical protein